MTFLSISDQQGAGKSKLKHNHNKIVHANKNLSSELIGILDDTLVSQYCLFKPGPEVGGLPMNKYYRLT